MSETANRGEGQSGRRGRAAGLTMLDLEDLPAVLRKIMRLLLRRTEMTYEELHEAVAALPEADRLSQPELDEALDALSQQQWLVRMSEDQRHTYKINHHRKPPSRLPANIWDALDSTDQSGNRPEQPDDQAPGS